MLGVRAKLFLASFAAIVLSVAVADVYLARTLDRELTASIRDDLLVRGELWPGRRSRSRPAAPRPGTPGPTRAGERRGRA